MDTKTASAEAIAEMLVETYGIKKSQQILQQLEVELTKRIGITTKDTCERCKEQPVKFYQNGMCEECNSELWAKV